PAQWGSDHGEVSRLSRGRGRAGRDTAGERSMPDNSGEFAALMERIRQGSEGAAEELVARHGPDILRVVRRRLSRRIRSKFDSADFTQSVWRSFFANAARTEEIRHPDELAAYLAEMAKNKVIDAFRRSLQT